MVSKILLPEEILNRSHRLTVNSSVKIVRDGVELEKGIPLSSKKIDEKMDFFKKYCWYYSIYPDKFIELITPVGSKFRLKFFQKIFLRACLREGRIVTVAPRAAGKSFICILALLLICIFRPHTKAFQCLPGKAQGAKVASQKVKQIFDLLPILKWEIQKENYGADYIQIELKNGSSFTLMSPLNSTRGQRATFGIIDEYRDHNADDISEIILPLLNVDRLMENQEKNPYEPQQGQLWISSASDKNTYAYDKTIEFLELAILDPRNVFLWGFSYKVPLKCGLLSQHYLNEMRLDSTFSEAGFAKEYMSRFVGTSSDAWFDFDKLTSRRKLSNPETKYSLDQGSQNFYILSLDVGRYGCQSACCVLKVFTSGDYWKINLINIVILGKTENEKVFDRQVLEFKKLIRDFRPKYAVIDINGIGVAFADYMIRETIDHETGEVFPPYGFFNRDEYETVQPRNCERILYGIKATAEINSEMHSTLFSKIYSGRVTFLISQKKAKEKLMATVVGRRMKIEDKMKRLQPHELTDHLINEIMNLKIKPTGTTNQIRVEQINSRIIKDKFSALEMGVWVVSQLEDDEMSHKRNRGLARQLSFFKIGGEKKRWQRT